MITVHLTEKLLRDLETRVREGEYPNRAEAIRSMLSAYIDVVDDRPGRKVKPLERRNKKKVNENTIEK